jgi:hypothetical protein
VLVAQVALAQVHCSHCQKKHSRAQGLVNEDAFAAMMRTEFAATDRVAHAAEQTTRFRSRRRQRIRVP